MLLQKARCEKFVKPWTLEIEFVQLTGNKKDSWRATTAKVEDLWFRIELESRTVGIWRTVKEEENPESMAEIPQNKLPGRTSPHPLKGA